MREVRSCRAHERADRNQSGEQQRNFDVVDDAISGRRIHQRAAERAACRQRRHRIPDTAADRYATTGRGGLQAFKVIPLVVYRVYPDGRPDELVRGADMVGTPLSSFAKILATSDRPEVFNGYCGAESGSVPVSAVSPAILVSGLEIQKKEKGNDRPPLLAPPMLTGGVQ